jgi:hypothetical protein
MSVGTAERYGAHAWLDGRSAVVLASVPPGPRCDLGVSEDGHAGRQALVLAARWLLAALAHLES